MSSTKSSPGVSCDQCQLLSSSNPENLGQASDVLIWDHSGESGPVLETHIGWAVSKSTWMESALIICLRKLLFSLSCQVH